MKYAFFGLCVVLALALSLLAVIFKTGRVPFAPVPAPVVAAPAPQPEERLTVFTSRGKEVDEMIEALKVEREQFIRRSNDLQNREEQFKLQEAILIRLRDELAELRKQLDANIISVKEMERANLRRMADVCGKMDAASAAQMLLAMEKERAAVILSMMNERNAAAIFDAAVAMDAKGPEKTAEWSDLIRRLAAANKKAKADKGV